MAKHRRPRTHRLRVSSALGTLHVPSLHVPSLNAPSLARSSKTLVVAAVSGGLLISGGIGSADGQPAGANADELAAPSHGEAALINVVPAAFTSSGRHAVTTVASEAANTVEAERIIAAVQAATDRREAAAAKAAAAKAAAAKAAAAKQAAEARAKEAAAAAARAKARASRTAQRVAPLPAGFGAKVLAIAARYAGVPYVYGGTTPSGFDCSGYVGYVFRQLGISLPRTAAQIRAATERITRSQLRPGDLVFVHKAGGVSHVAIYAGANMWWEANRPGRPVGKHAAWTTSVSYGRVAA